jgi:hypothetical protein
MTGTGSTRSRCTRRRGRSSRPLRCSGRARSTSPRPLQQIDALTHWFLTLQRRGSAARVQALADLQRLSAFPERTARFIARSAHTRCDFSNVGGIDVELCNVARFFPTFSLRRPADR